MKPGKKVYEKSLLLEPLLKANPDLIVITGNAYAVQKVLADYLRINPALGNITAIKQGALFVPSVLLY